MQIVWDRQAWDLSTCKRREKMRDLEMMAHMQHEIDDLKKRLRQEQSLRKEIRSREFPIKITEEMMYLWKCTCADCGREFDWYDNYPPLECVKCESVEIKNEFKGRAYD